jgi:hypothetical protein
MPVYFVLATVMAVMTASVIALDVFINGGPMARLWLFMVAWVIVIILWGLGI